MSSTYTIIKELNLWDTYSSVGKMFFPLASVKIYKFIFDFLKFEYDTPPYGFFCLAFVLWGILWASGGLVFDINFGGKFSVIIIASNIASVPFTFSSYSGIPITRMLPLW